MMNPIFNEDDKNFKLLTFRKISFLLSRVDINNDFSFVDSSGFNRQLNPDCIEVVFFDFMEGDIFIRINLQSVEIDVEQSLEKYKKLIRSIIFDKIDFTQISREIKLINLLD